MGDRRLRVVIGTWAWLRLGDLTEANTKALRKALTVFPKGGHPSEEPRPVFLFNTSRKGWFGVPREYYLPRRKAHHEVRYLYTDRPGDDWPGDLTFKGQLRESQEAAMRDVLAAINKTHYHGRGPAGLGGMVKAPTGWGKCLRLGTLTTTYSGRLVKVEDLKVGDRLMGPDSAPRMVTALGRGRGPMYRITPVKGAPWECNDEHILTLVHTTKGTLKDVCISEWVDWSKTQKRLWKQFAPPNGVDFPPSLPLPIDPYFVGVWYGDGTKSLNGVGISKPDDEIRQLCAETAERWGLRLRVDRCKPSCPTYHLVGKPGQNNPLLSALRGVHGDGQRLPHEYLTASRADRLGFLAGFLDTDGYNNRGVLEIIQKHKAWIEDLAFLGRSLGFKAVYSEKIVKGVSYWRMRFSGDFSEVPFRLARKTPGDRRQKKVATRTGFSVEAIGDGEWAGFTLDGDGRFLLGDFTVTHNTVYCCALIARMNVPTLILVNNKALLDQWVEELKAFLPGVQVGRAQGKVLDYQGKHVVMGMVQSLSNKELPEGFRRWPGIVIGDEAHHAAARTYIKVVTSMKARWRFGVTATPFRADGTERVYYSHIGPMLHVGKELLEKPTIGRVRSRFTAPTPSSEDNEAKLFAAMVDDRVRNRLIILQVNRALDAGRQILVSSKRRDHLTNLKAMFERLRMAWVVLRSEESEATPEERESARRVYGTSEGDGIPALKVVQAWGRERGHELPEQVVCMGGLSKKALKRGKSHASLIWGTVHFVGEGFNVPRLDTLIVAMPLVNCEQLTGRILRRHEGKRPPLVIDIRDDSVRMLTAYGRKRDEVYAKLMR